MLKLILNPVFISALPSSKAKNAELHENYIAKEKI